MALPSTRSLSTRPRSTPFDHRDRIVLKGRTLARQHFAAVLVTFENNGAVRPHWIGDEDAVDRAQPLLREWAKRIVVTRPHSMRGAP